MHLLNIEQSGDLYTSGEAIDLAQSPGRIVILTAADSEISLMAAAARARDLAAGDLRLANLLALSHPFSVDIYVEKTLAQAQLILVRLLGGVGYWAYGVEQLSRLAKEKNIHLAMIAGDGRPDAELAKYSSLPPEILAQLAAYLDHGGLDNAEALLMALDDIINATNTAPPPRPLLKAGLYWHDARVVDFADMEAIWRRENLDEDAPIAALVCYRALMQGGRCAPMDALISALTARGIRALPLYAASLKDAESSAVIASLLRQADAGVIINATSFAVSDPASPAGTEAGSEKSSSSQSPGAFGVVDAPVIQIMLSASTQAQWQDSLAGLTPRDLAMNVVLPELDGRIISRAIGFKTLPKRDPLTEAMTSDYEAHQGRCAWVAELAKNWLNLRAKPPEEKRLALVLANYPNRDGRLANGVGLDTPASALVVLRALAGAGYVVGDLPDDTETLMQTISTRPTNSGIEGRAVDAWLPLADYERHFTDLPKPTQKLIRARWGEAASDPMLGTAPDGVSAFALPVVMQGQVALAIQPARGYNIDPKSSYHSPDLPPPHHYLAFYFWCRHHHQADAMISLGKHGNLEWLPGKALALDAECLPEICLGAMPHFYPFIVNDPGEGSQAKRRSAAVILDHLTPPMTLADSHGVMAELEASMDEYYEAVGVDKRRGALLMEDILAQAERAGLAQDCGIVASDSMDEKLFKLDNFLCDIKEMQIRDGLHIFGQMMDTPQFVDLLVAILRIPRGDGEGANQSLLRALAGDILGDAEFDPLTCTRAENWQGARPSVLAEMDDAKWRSQGDTAERLHRLARQLVADERPAPKTWKQTRLVLEHALPELRQAISQSPLDEVRFLLRGLAGKYVPAGASGAPTRGKIEVLPTGRNFFSVDTRAVPTPAAWRIGWASAGAMIDRYVQDHGNYPKSMVLSVWGTANMRTGGDDLAQALALMGVQPKWETASRRVIGFDIMPVSVLGRPRVDITLRASGFFRDAFPSQMTLFDKAVRAVAALDEAAEDNPLAANYRREYGACINAGMRDEDATRIAGFRIFSTPPGSYGAGMQTLIDEGLWQSRADFAEVFLTWGSYAYGEAESGVAAQGAFTRRLQSIDAVLHNQDNREHDILDSDDYYQFAGGLGATIATLKGADVPIYLGDHALGDHALGDAPRVRSLGEEISRIIRGRASNPKWISGVMRHGYKGAFEMAATLDYLFAFAATTRQVEDHHFDALFDGWMAEVPVAEFIQKHNPAAWDEMLKRFQEAVDRGLWHPRRNMTRETLAQYQKNRHNKRCNPEPQKRLK